jgi:endonuclease G
LETLGGLKNVTAIDLGYRYKEGKRTDEIVIRLHVLEKKKETDLEASEIFPKEIAGVPTDVIQATYRSQGEIGTSTRRRERLEPIQPGISVSHKSVTAGTIGSIVYDKTTGKPCILSNWHVLAGSASAVPGALLYSPVRLTEGPSPQIR